jgi:hypothetical protein
MYFALASGEPGCSNPITGIAVCVGFDPAGGATNQGRRPRGCRQRGRLCAQDQRALDRGRNLWTLRDNFRRIAIPVSVARECDPREVRAILLKVAHDNPDVMTTPAPAVELEEFGADSLEFKLFAVA